MYLRKCLLSFSVLFLLLSFVQSVNACEFCTIPQIGKHDQHQTRIEEGRWSFKYLFEGQNWKEKNAEEAHELHEDGHHIHDKTIEQIHHFETRAQLNENLQLILDLPYVIRHSLEIENHSILGSKQKSDGLGDLTAIGVYRLWQKDTDSFNATGGVKFPTGETNEKNSIETRFEQELQPGSGSFDHFLGALFKNTINNHSYNTNIAYIYKLEGAQNYEFGDVLAATVLWEYLHSINSNNILKFGVDAGIQHEQKHKDDGAKVSDSGGTTILIGPSLALETGNMVSFFGSIQFPAYQNLGGVHQEINFTWTAGGKIAF